MLTLNSFYCKITASRKCLIITRKKYCLTEELGNKMFFMYKNQSYTYKKVYIKDYNKY